MANNHPKPYLILVRYEGHWSIRAEYETLSTAETHAKDVLLSEYPQDIKIVKDLGLEVKVSDDTTDKIEYRDWLFR